VIRVLFLCVHNSARSQMAEGFLRAWGGDRFEARSAGVEASEVRPLAIQAMAELGIDISEHESKVVGAFEGDAFDYAITVCDEAKEACPYFGAAANHWNWAFDDPSAATGSEEERRALYRRVRDEIGARIRTELLPLG
jgi:arsenate reductase